MILLIVALPLLGFLSAGIFGNYIGVGSCIITTMFIFLSLCFSINVAWNISIFHFTYKCVALEWICSETLQINWGFSIDSLTVIMLIVVTLISFFVHVYSIEYMSHDPHLPRFMSYLSFFTFFMLILVTANNFLQMFIGWEGVGVCSFLLINFWFTRIQANKAAIKAMLINRIGDFFLLLALFSIFFIYKSFDYDVIFNITPLMAYIQISILNFNFSALDIICLFLFAGATGKSAQIGLHTWLPDAMEGPTPVSALIHAATMVTAGVFLLARCSYLFEFAQNILNLIIVIGSITAFFAATSGLFQNDIKRIIAYSTCSQLGYMIFSCGLSNYDIGVFHLTNHAFFKALLFLGAGAVIHSVADEQDIRKMGGLKNKLFLYYKIFLIGSLALIGFPFLSGFFSKDLILEAAFVKSNTFGFFAYILGILGAFCTAFYSTRLLLLVFLSKPNGHKKIIVNAHKGTYYLNIPLLLLSVLSICSGYILFHIFVGPGTNFWGASLYILPENYVLSDAEFESFLFKNIPFLCTCIGSYSAVSVYYYNLNFFYKLKQYFLIKIIYTFFIKKWYFDRIYNQFIGQNILTFGLKFAYEAMDRGLLEMCGPYKITKNLIFLSKTNTWHTDGEVDKYLLIFIIISFNTLLFFILIY